MEKKYMVESEIYDKTWEIELEPSNDKQELKIRFTYPISLPMCKITDKSMIQLIKENNNDDKLQKFFQSKLDSIIKKKYNDKIKDSFNTFYKIKAFQQVIVTQELECEDIEFDLTCRIKKEDIKLYVYEYMQYKEKINKINRIDIEEKFNLFLLPLKNSKSAKEHDKHEICQKLYNENLKKYQEYYSQNIFSFEQFREMLSQTECAYCGVSMEKIEKLRDVNKIASKSGRGFSLEIDRKEPNLEYTAENCCMSCYWCNNAKTDEFSVEEFESIAKGIHDVWEDRLEREITFPKETYKDKNK